MENQEETEQLKMLHEFVRTNGQNITGSVQSDDPSTTKEAVIPQSYYQFVMGVARNYVRDVEEGDLHPDTAHNMFQPEALVHVCKELLRMDRVRESLMSAAQAGESVKLTVEDVEDLFDLCRK